MSTTVDDIALRDCPFCGSSAFHVIWREQGTPLIYVTCHGCAVATREFDTKLAATNAWNLRVKMGPFLDEEREKRHKLHKENGYLRKELERMKGTLSERK